MTVANADRELNVEKEENVAPNQATVFASK
jgi:hypothetical protein